MRVFQPAETLPAFVLHWAKEFGGNACQITRLRGGINNQVFRLSNRTMRCVIKGYPPLEPGQRDRMKAEVQFLRYAQKVAPGFTPDLINADENNRCVVMEHLEGQIFEEESMPRPDEINRAVIFLQLLNQSPNDAIKSVEMDAAESFLSLSEHLMNVEKRLNNMTTSHIHTESKSLAGGLIDNIRSELNVVWKLTGELIAKGSIMDNIKPEDRWVSPSDFGFHNALVTSTGIRFIDFEFAGWDDPAKACLDFVLQPRISVWNHVCPLSFAWNSEQKKQIENRCQRLAPILKLKWLCIILAVLNPERLTNMLKNDPEIDATDLIKQRLKSAESYMTRIQIFNGYQS